MPSQGSVTNTTGYVNYVYNISSRGTAQVASQLMGLSGIAGNILGQLAFQTSSYLSTAEGSLLTLGTVASAGLSKATQFAMKFNQEMETVHAISGKSVTQLSEDAMEMSNKYGVALDSMTKGLEALARAGVSTGNMTNILDQAMGLSKLEGLPLEKSINALISTTNLLDTSNLDLESPEYAEAVKYQTQKITATSEAAPINAQDIIHTLEHVGGYASSTKLDQDDLYAVIAQLGSKGTKSEMAGTSLRAFLAAGQKDTAQRALKRIGLNVKDLWKDDETIMSISDMKDVLDEAMEARGYTQQEKLEFYSDFTGYKQANQIMKIDTTSVREFKDKIDRSWDTSKKMETVLNTAQTHLQSLMQTGVNFLTKVGEPFLPIVSVISKTLKTMIDIVDAIPFSNWIVALGLTLVSVKAISTIMNKVLPSLLAHENSIFSIKNLWEDTRESVQETFDIISNAGNFKHLRLIEVYNETQRVTDEDKIEYWRNERGMPVQNMNDVRMLEAKAGSEYIDKIRAWKREKMNLSSGFYTNKNDDKRNRNAQESHVTDALNILKNIESILKNTFGDGGDTSVDSVLGKKIDDLSKNIVDLTQVHQGTLEAINSTINNTYELLNGTKQSTQDSSVSFTLPGMAEMANALQNQCNAIKDIDLSSLNNIDTNVGRILEILEQKIADKKFVGKREEAQALTNFGALVNQGDAHVRDMERTSRRKRISLNHSLFDPFEFIEKNIDQITKAWTKHGIDRTKFDKIDFNFGFDTSTVEGKDLDRIAREMLLDAFKSYNIGMRTRLKGLSEEAIMADLGNRVRFRDASGRNTSVGNYFETILPYKLQQDRPQGFYVPSKGTQQAKVEVVYVEKDGKHVPIAKDIAMSNFASRSAFGFTKDDIIRDAYGNMITDKIPLTEEVKGIGYEYEPRSGGRITSEKQGTTTRVWSKKQNKYIDVPDDSLRTKDVTYSRPVIVGKGGKFIDVSKPGEIPTLSYGINNTIKKDELTGKQLTQADTLEQRKNLFGSRFRVATSIDDRKNNKYENFTGDEVQTLFKYMKETLSIDFVKLLSGQSYDDMSASQRKNFKKELKEKYGEALQLDNSGNIALGSRIHNQHLGMNVLLEAIQNDKSQEHIRNNLTNFVTKKRYGTWTELENRTQKAAMDKLSIPQLKAIAMLGGVDLTDAYTKKKDGSRGRFDKSKAIELLGDSYGQVPFELMEDFRANPSEAMQYMKSDAYNYAQKLETLYSTTFSRAFTQGGLSGELKKEFESKFSLEGGSDWEKMANFIMNGDGTQFAEADQWVRNKLGIADFDSYVKYSPKGHIKYNSHSMLDENIDPNYIVTMANVGSDGIHDMRGNFATIVSLIMELGFNRASDEIKKANTTTPNWLSDKRWQMLNDPVNPNREYKNLEETKDYGLRKKNMDAHRFDTRYSGTIGDENVDNEKLVVSEPKSYNPQSLMKFKTVVTDAFYEDINSRYYNNYGDDHSGNKSSTIPSLLTTVFNDPDIFDLIVHSDDMVLGDYLKEWGEDVPYELLNEWQDFVEKVQKIRQQRRKEYYNNIDPFAKERKKMTGWDKDKRARYLVDPANRKAGAVPAVDAGVQAGGRAEYEPIPTLIDDNGEQVIAGGIFMRRPTPGRDFQRNVKTEPFVTNTILNDEQKEEIQKKINNVMPEDKMVHSMMRAINNAMGTDIKYNDIQTIVTEIQKEYGETFVDLQHQKFDAQMQGIRTGIGVNVLKGEYGENTIKVQQIEQKISQIRHNIGQESPLHALALYLYDAQINQGNVTDIAEDFAHKFDQDIERIESQLTDSNWRENNAEKIKKYERKLKIMKDVRFNRLRNKDGDNDIASMLTFLKEKAEYEQIEVESFLEKYGIDEFQAERGLGIDNKDKKGFAKKWKKKKGDLDTTLMLIQQLEQADDIDTNHVNYFIKKAIQDKVAPQVKYDEVATAFLRNDQGVYSDVVSNTLEMNRNKKAWGYQLNDLRTNLALDYGISEYNIHAPELTKAQQQRVDEIYNKQKFVGISEYIDKHGIKAFEDMRKEMLIKFAYQDRHTGEWQEYAPFMKTMDEVNELYGDFDSNTMELMENGMVLDFNTLHLTHAEIAEQVQLEDVLKSIDTMEEAKKVMYKQVEVATDLNNIKLVIDESGEVIQKVGQQLEEGEQELESVKDALQRVPSYLRDQILTSNEKFGEFAVNNDQMQNVIEEHRRDIPDMYEALKQHGNIGSILELIKHEDEQLYNELVDYGQARADMLIAYEFQLLTERDATIEEAERVLQAHNIVSEAAVYVADYQNYHQSAKMHEDMKHATETGDWDTVQKEIDMMKQEMYFDNDDYDSEYYINEYGEKIDKATGLPFLTQEEFDTEEWSLGAPVDAFTQSIGKAWNTNIAGSTISKGNIDSNEEVYQREEFNLSQQEDMGDTFITRAQSAKRSEEEQMRYELKQRGHSDKDIEEIVKAYKSGIRSGTNPLEENVGNDVQKQRAKVLAELRERQILIGKLSKEGADKIGLINIQKADLDEMTTEELIKFAHDIDTKMSNINISLEDAMEVNDVHKELSVINAIKEVGETTSTHLSELERNKVVKPLDDDAYGKAMMEGMRVANYDEELERAKQTQEDLYKRTMSRDAERRSKEAKKAQRAKDTLAHVDYLTVNPSYQKLPEDYGDINRLQAIQEYNQKKKAFYSNPSQETFDAFYALRQVQTIEDDTILGEDAEEEDKTKLRAKQRVRIGIEKEMANMFASDNLDDMIFSTFADSEIDYEKINEQLYKQYYDENFYDLGYKDEESGKEIHKRVSTFGGMSGHKYWQDYLQSQYEPRIEDTIIQKESNGVEYIQSEWFDQMWQGALYSASKGVGGTDALGEAVAGIKSTFYRFLGKALSDFSDVDLTPNYQVVEATDKFNQHLTKATNHLNAITSVLHEFSDVFPPLEIAVLGVQSVIAGINKVQSLNTKVQDFMTMGVDLSKGKVLQSFIPGGENITADTYLGQFIMGASSRLSKAMTVIGDLLNKYTPALMAIGASLFVVKVGLDWSYQSHQKWLKTLEEEQKERRSRTKSLQATAQDARSLAEKNRAPRQQDALDRSAILAQQRLENANMSRAKGAIDFTRAKNDTLWGDYGISAGLSKISGTYESTADEYDGTSKEIRKVKEATLANPFATGSMRQVAAYYDANQLAFGQMDEYKDELGELYDTETNIMKKVGPDQDARGTPQFQKALDKFVEATGITRDHAQKYLDYMQTEHNVDKATQAMQAQADTISAQTEMKIQAISFGGNPADVLGLNGIEAQQNAMIKAQADMIKMELSGQLWWKAVWATITAPIKLIISPIFAIANILGAIWAFMTGNWSDAWDKAGKAAGSFNAFDEAATYWGAWGEVEGTDFTSIGQNAVDERNRRNYGNATATASGMGYHNAPQVPSGKYDMIGQFFQRDKPQEPSSFHHDRKQGIIAGFFGGVMSLLGTIISILTTGLLLGGVAAGVKKIFDAKGISINADSLSKGFGAIKDKITGFDLGNIKDLTLKDMVTGGVERIKNISLGGIWDTVSGKGKGLKETIKNKAMWGRFGLENLIYGQPEEGSGTIIKDGKVVPTGERSGGLKDKYQSFVEQHKDNAWVQYGNKKLQSAKQLPDKLKEQYVNPWKDYISEQASSYVNGLIPLGEDYDDFNKKKRSYLNNDDLDFISEKYGITSDEKTAKLRSRDVRKQLDKKGLWGEASEELYRRQQKEAAGGPLGIVKAHINEKYVAPWKEHIQKRADQGKEKGKEWLASQKDKFMDKYGERFGLTVGDTSIFDALQDPEKMESFVKDKFANAKDGTLLAQVRDKVTTGKELLQDPEKLHGVLKDRYGDKIQRGKELLQDPEAMEGFVKDKFTNLKDKVTNFFDIDDEDDGKSFFRKHFDNIKEKVMSFFGKKGEADETDEDTPLLNTSEIIQNSTMEDAKEAMGKLFGPKELPGDDEDVIDLGPDEWSTVSSKIEGSFTDRIRDYIDGLQGTMGDIFENMKNNIQGFDIGEKFQSVKDRLSGLFGDDENGEPGFFKKHFNKFKDKIFSFFGKKSESEPEDGGMIDSLPGTAQKLLGMSDDDGVIDLGPDEWSTVSSSIETSFTDRIRNKFRRKKKNVEPESEPESEPEDVGEGEYKYNSMFGFFRDLHREKKEAQATEAEAAAANAKKMAKEKHMYQGEYYEGFDLGDNLNIDEGVSRTFHRAKDKISEKFGLSDKIPLLGGGGSIVPHRKPAGSVEGSNPSFLGGDNGIIDLMPGEWSTVSTSSEGGSLFDRVRSGLSDKRNSASSSFGNAKEFMSNKLGGGKLGGGKVGGALKGLGGKLGKTGIGKAGSKVLSKVGGKLGKTGIGKAGSKVLSKVGGKLGGKLLAKGGSQVLSKVLAGGLAATGIGAPLAAIMASPIGGFLIEGAMNLGGAALGGVGKAFGGVKKALGFGGYNNTGGGGLLGGAMGLGGMLGLGGMVAGGVGGMLGGILGMGKGSKGGGVFGIMAGALTTISGKHDKNLELSEKQNKAMNKVADKVSSNSNSSTTGGNITIQNININTDDDPEAIKAMFLDLIVELQEQVNPRLVSRTTGSSNTSTSDSSDQTSSDQSQQQSGSGISNTTNPGLGGH